MLPNKRFGQSKQKCAICYPNDSETPMIKEALLERMKVAKAKEMAREQSNEQGKTEYIDFQRLIKMMYTRKYKNFKATNSCKHSQLKKQFTIRLKCAHKDIDRISDFIAWRLSKFNYHLDTLATQIKNFPRHFPCKPKPPVRSINDSETERRVPDNPILETTKKTVKKREGHLGIKQEEEGAMGEARDEHISRQLKISAPLHQNAFSGNQQRKTFPSSESHLPSSVPHNLFVPTFPSFGHLYDFNNRPYFPQNNLSWSYLYPAIEQDDLIDLQSSHQPHEDEADSNKERGDK